MKKSLNVWGALALLVVASACEKSSPAKPSDLATTAQAGSVTDAATGITLTAPQAVTPTSNQQFKNVEQPVTLTVKNGVTTGATALTYTFEVATDAAFAAIVYSKAAVAEGGGQTTLKIDTIGADKNYFWRARVTSGSIAGPNSATRGFTIGPEVILQAPTANAPAQGATVSGSEVTLTANNVGRTGPAGQILYRFEFANSASFANLLLSSTVAEQSGGRTSVTVTTALPAGTYFWRVTASDLSNAVTSPTSAVVSFTYQPFQMSQATMVDNPADLGSWPETAKITSVQFTGNAFLVDFDRRTGPNRWLDVPFGTGDLQYTLGLCVNNGGKWFCSAAIQFWFGRDLGASAPPSLVGIEWWYDSRWGPILGYQPQDNETVGVFVAAGNLRDASYTAASCPRICERSNVAFVSWQNHNPANFTFGNAGIKR